MAAWDSFDGVVTGRVRSVNPKGLLLEGHTDWLNISRFAVGVVLPEKGAAVAVTLDKAGFVRSVDVVDGSVGANGHDAPRIDAQRVSAPSEKDRTITRLAVLKAAAAFGASRPELRSRDVIAIAAVWERWVLSPDVALPAEPALDEAF